MKKILLLIVILIIIIICYKFLLYQFRSYKNLKNIFLNKIEGSDPNFMNFGFWDGKYTLKEANVQLCNKLFNNIPNYQRLKILDVGCGYGKQDIILAKKYYNSTIYCIDIEKEHVKEAELLFKQSGLKNEVFFNQGDACNLLFTNNNFDIVISLESAFHYTPRRKFFEETYRVLKPGGCLLIYDILFPKKNMLCNTYQSIAAKFMNVPNTNKQDLIEWSNELTDIGFIVETEDITDYTILPFFQYISENHPSMDNKIINFLSSNIIIPICKKMCEKYKPFTYIFAVCKKPYEYVK